MEELSERLGVSKSHLVRTFTAAVGVPPGRSLTTVRVEAAMRLLLHREYLSLIHIYLAHIELAEVGTAELCNEDGQGLFVCRIRCV